MAVMDIVGILLTTARVTTDNTIVLAERHRQPLVLNSALPARRSLSVGRRIPKPVMSSSLFYSLVLCGFLWPYLNNRSIWH